jgi:hypothetical protein
LRDDRPAVERRVSLERTHFVEFVAAGEAEDANARLSELSLESVIDDQSSRCRRWWNLSSVHAKGSTLFV